MRHEVVNAMKHNPALVRAMLNGDKNGKIQALKAAGLYHAALNKVAAQQPIATPKGYSCARCIICM